MILNLYGEIAEAVWKEIPLHYPDISNEIFVVMPNHIHGLISIQDSRRAGSKPAPTRLYTLSEIVRVFKTYSSRRINSGIYRGHLLATRLLRACIRSENEYHLTGEYILYNPAKWE
jgi:putative transposase